MTTRRRPSVSTDYTVEQLREMDGEIQRKVFGTDEKFIHFEPKGKTIDVGEGHSWHVAPCPAYTTDQRASGDLRDKLAERWNWILAYGRTRPEEQPYGFALYAKTGKPEREPLFIEESDTEELAVVLVALRVIGG